MIEYTKRPVIARNGHTVVVMWNGDAHESSWKNAPLARRVTAILETLDPGVDEDATSIFMRGVRIMEGESDAG